MRIKKQAASACAVAALAVVVGWATIAGATWARQNSSANSAAATAQSQNSVQNGSASSDSSAADQDPLAAAARKAKQQKSQNAKPAKVFTNDNLPSTGVSTVGNSDAAGASVDASANSAAAPGGQGEKYWRDKFASLNKKLEQDQEELGIMQRELGQLNLQNYSDPNVAMQQGYSRSDIDKKTADIDAKQKQVDADKQAISDAEDDLRKSGGDAGWAR